MYQQVEAEQDFSERAFQEASPPAYPQLCGSWPGDEWPEDDVSGDRYSDHANLCLFAESAREGWS